MFYLIDIVVLIPGSQQFSEEYGVSETLLLTEFIEFKFEKVEKGWKSVTKGEFIPNQNSSWELEFCWARFK